MRVICDVLLTLSGALTGAALVWAGVALSFHLLDRKDGTTSRSVSEHRRALEALRDAGKEVRNDNDK